MQKLNKILLVDDDQALNYLSRATLSELNAAADITEVSDGMEALDFVVNNSCPDIIFLDIKMPVMDGFDFLDALTASNICRNVKVVILTSSIRPDDRQKAFTYKYVIDYFEKPLTEKMVYTIMNRLDS
jgi:CheY-like chemotaxis protein